eukprot:TRINITY_DN9645_c0_g1_i1.p1 TRINITY_DN9645_c0_g1~~TRINITY_DN9645_c0_g1_i1.p1  ORF type:complete len:121 (-),score=30.83 TRINITY_DN9645_c0_g1_i1:264-626(-)
MLAIRGLVRSGVAARRVVPLGRGTASTAGETGSAGEKHLLEVIQAGMTAEHVSVKDISGGCGSMYEIYVASDDFKGMPLVKQHKLVKGVLAEDIKDMHGLTMKTATIEKHDAAAAKRPAL